MIEILNVLTQELTLITILTKQQLPILGKILLLLIIILAIDTILKHRLCLLGISPRKIYGIPGILFAPFLHANANHLFFNSIPLIVLSDFLLFNGIHYYLIITLKIILISGSLIWCFGKTGIHIGASALISGYWGLLVCKSYQDPTFISILLGIICIYYFAGIFYSIFPSNFSSKQRVSWEGHLFGLISGILVSGIWIN